MQVQSLLGQIGLEPERVGMVNLSAAMAAEFVVAAEEMTARVKELGPNPLRSRDGR
jgi:F420-non-reducing hydrogenase iron-sulfur subunit